MKEIGPRLVIATHNEGKLRELRSLLRDFDIEALGARELDLAEPDETEETFVGNARIKAHAAAAATGLPALSDDSGIEVDALGGAPGVHTADWAETPEGRDFPMAMRRVWELVVAAGPGAPRTARFRATLCLAWPDGEDEIFEGKAEGHVDWPMRGELGFGFDPMFVPKGHDRTFGQMPPEEKEPLTHRAAAFARLRRRLAA